MVGVVGSHKVADCSRAHQFSRLNGPQGGLIALKLSQNIAKAWPISLTSWVVISSKVAACTSQLDGHLSTHGHLEGLRNKPQQKQTHQHLSVAHW